MSAAVLEEVEVVVRPEGWPRLRSCDRCGERVLLARHRGAGRPMVLELVEVFPEGRCGRCSGRGTCRVDVHQVGGRSRSVEPGDLAGRMTLASVACPACWGRGVRGEPVPADAVAVDYRGIGRRLRPDEDRAPGEAFHAPHRCRR